jgi:hypothetical protein
VTLVLTAVYIVCFQLCAWPSIVRIIRRGTSADLSIWREVLLLIGASAQLAVMLRTGAAWQIVISPILSGLNILALVYVIRRYRVE